MTLPLSPPCPRQVASLTAGISRIPTTDMGPPAPQNAGGGDMNGTAATSILLHQSGTAAGKINVPRLFHNPGNWCGTV